MIEALFLISLVTFATCALTWFALWAAWIHAPKAAYGPALSEEAEAVIAEPMNPVVARRLDWYRRVKHITLVFLAVTIALGAAVAL